jgi:hypothetical protein
MLDERWASRRYANSRGDLEDDGRQDVTLIRWVMIRRSFLQIITDRPKLTGSLAGGKILT